MSEEYYGYGKDIKYDINGDGIIDISVSDSGDIAVVGGDGETDLETRRKNAIQQIILRIITPFGSLKDETGTPIEYGSNVHSLIGEKHNAVNEMIMRAYILACLSDYAPLEAILQLDIKFPEPNLAKITLGIKLKDDNQVLFETIELGGT